MKHIRSNLHGKKIFLENSVWKKPQYLKRISHKYYKFGYIQVMDYALIFVLKVISLASFRLFPNDIILLIIFIPLFYI